MIQEKRGMFKNWNVFLMMLTFASMFFGTAFIRSGLLTSVHAFAASNIGPWFMGAMLVILIACAILWLTRLDTLHSENKLESAFSREGIFLIQNVLFLSTAFTVFIGTMFPILSEALTGQKITVGPPFYDQVAGPQMAVLVLLMGVAPLLAWHKANGKAVGRQMLGSVLFAVAVMVVMFIAGATQPVPLLGFGLCAYTLAQTVMEFVRGARARMKGMDENPFTALLRLAQKNQQRYGGYIIHIGIVLIAIGAIGKGFYGTDVIRNVKLNESFSVAGYEFVYRGIRPVPCEFNDCQTMQGMLLMKDANTGNVVEGLFRIATTTRSSSIRQRFHSSAARLTTKSTHFWPAGKSNGATASFQVYVNPLINWIWVGGIIVIIGFFVAFWPMPEKGHSAVRATSRQVAGAPAK